MKRCVNCGSNITNQSGVCRRCLIKQPDWYQNLDEETTKKYNKSRYLQRYWGGIGILLIGVGIVLIIFTTYILIPIGLIIIGAAIFAFT